MSSLNSQFNFFVLQNMVNKSHPALYAIVMEFQKEEEDTTAMMKDLDGGKKIRQATRKKYQNINFRLQALADNHYQEYKQEGRLLDYMEACGHNVGL